MRKHRTSPTRQGDATQHNKQKGINHRIKTGKTSEKRAKKQDDLKLLLEPRQDEPMTIDTHPSKSKAGDQLKQGYGFGLKRRWPWL